MAGAVYFVGAFASVGCAVLLGRSWLRTRQRLLLWSALGFTGLALNNVLLLTSRVLTPEADLALLRDASALAGVTILLFGLIWESR